MPQSNKICEVRALDHFVLTVANIPETVQFYTHVLGMHAEQFHTSDGQTRWALKYGQSKINLHQKGQEFEPKAAHPTAGSADLCFVTDAPLNHWVEHLASKSIVIEEGPVARTGANGPLTSLYVRDPDQNLIEISVRG